MIQAADRNPAVPLGGPGNVIAVESATNFCIFLPPFRSDPNDYISIEYSEGYPLAPPEIAKDFARAHCTQANSNAPGHEMMYDDFLTGVHFGRNDSMAWITGRIDATKAPIKVTSGGFFDLDDNVNSPPGGMCHGYDSFFNMINPVDGIFCLKCCKGIKGCNISNWQQGCAGMVPGDYSLGFDNNVPPPRTGRTISNGTTTRTPEPTTTSGRNYAVSSFPSYLMSLALIFL
jgi:hypothetical protein